MSKIANEFLEKTTYEVKIYTFDYSEELETGETISFAAVTALPTGIGHLTIGAPAIAGQSVQVQISGGTANTLYVVTCKVTTSAGESIEGSGNLLVLSI